MNAPSVGFGASRDAIESCAALYSAEPGRQALPALAFSRRSAGQAKDRAPPAGGRRMRRNLLLLVPAALAVAGCTAHVGEDSLLHPTPGGAIPADALASAAPAYSLTEHRIAGADGARLSAVLLRQPGARATILYFGGNGYTMERFGAWTAGIFAPLGVDLMIVDHRGYGRSEGTPTQANIEATGSPPSTISPASAASRRSSSTASRSAASSPAGSPRRGPPPESSWKARRPRPRTGSIPATAASPGRWSGSRSTRLCAAGATSPTWP